MYFFSGAGDPKKLPAPEFYIELTKIRNKLNQYFQKKNATQVNHAY
jgi:hypothetical protein